MSSLKRTTAVIASLAFLALAGVPASSVAQEDGVFVDPESPAGKEYAVPLEEARRNSRGKDTDEGGRSGATEYRSDAFGDGIDSDDDGGTSAGGDDDGVSEGDGTATDDDAATDDAENTSSPVASSDSDDDGGGLSGGAVTLGLLLLVLGGGALLAWFLRRGGTSQTA